MPAKKVIDPEEVRKCAALGATIPEIAQFVGCGHATIERRFMKEVHAGRSEGTLRAKGRIYQKGVVNGEYKSLELYLANTADWTVRPPVSVVTNVTQNAGLFHTPPELKDHLVTLRNAIEEEAKKGQNGDSAPAPER
jgi:hypothetical protein